MPWHLTVNDWLARSAVESLFVLAVGSLAVVVCRQPVRRTRLIAWTLGGCLVVPWLWLLPGWPRGGIADFGFWIADWRPPRSAEHTRLTRSASEPAGGSRRQAEGGGQKTVETGQEKSAERGLGSAEPVRGEDEGKGGIAEREDNAERTNHPPAVIARSALAPNPQSAIGNPQLPIWLATAYLAGVATMAAWWLAGIVALARLLRAGRAADERCRAIWQQVAGDAGRRTRLVVSSRVAQPFTFTWRRPIVVLPSRLCRRGQEQALCWSLAHEWSHVARRDAWSWTLAGIARVVFFYQPLVWWLRARLRLEQDYLADAASAGHAPAVEDYAEFLTCLAAGRRVRPVAGLGIGGKRSELYRRVVMLVARQKPLDSRCPRVWSLAAALAAIVLVVTASTYGDPPGGKRAGEATNAGRATASSAPGFPPESDRAEAADREGAGGPTSDAEDTSDVRRLVDLALKRSKAITGGEFLFQFMDSGNSNPPNAASWRFRRSDPSWSLGVIGGNALTISHAGRTVDLGKSPFVPPGSATNMMISHAKPWWSRSLPLPSWVSQAQPLPPLKAGTIWYDGTRQFIAEHRRDARLGDGEEINGVAVQRLEWTVAADELSAFQEWNQMLEQGGLLRLYVADELAGALPRMEYVDRFGTVQATFDAADFKKQKHQPDIFLPKEFSIRFGSERNYFMLEVKRLNEPIPAEEFSDFEVPAGTKVSDARPKRTDTFTSDGQGPFTTEKYPFRQFTTGAAYLHGLPVELLKEMDRDVVPPEEAEAAKAASPPDDPKQAATIGNAPQSAPARLAGDRTLLRYGGMSFDEWEEQLVTDLEPESRMEAIKAIGVLGANGYAEEAVRAISKTFAAGDAAVNSTACSALAKIGAPAVEVLVGAFGSNTDELSMNAMSAIAEIGPPAQAALPALLTICADHKSTWRTLAALALAKVGAANVELTSTFRRLIRDNDSVVRASLVQGLAERLGENPRLLPLLVAATKDIEPRVRSSAGQALVAHGYKTETVIDALRRLIRDEDPDVSDDVLVALLNERKNVETTTPVLVDAIVAMNTQDDGRSCDAVQALGRAGPKAAAAVPTLIEIVKGQGQIGIIKEAMNALGQIGPGAKQAIPALQLWVDRNDVPQDIDLRRHAARALERIQAEPSPKSDEGGE